MAFARNGETPTDREDKLKNCSNVLIIEIMKILLLLLIYGLLAPNDGAWMLRLFSCNQPTEVVY